MTRQIGKAACVLLDPVTRETVSAHETCAARWVFAGEESDASRSKAANEAHKYPDNEDSLLAQGAKIAAAELWDVLSNSAENASRETQQTP